jgi:hypothetical protein
MPVCPSTHLHGATQLPMGRFSGNLIYEYFFENLSRKFKIH